MKLKAWEVFLSVFTLGPVFTLGLYLVWITYKDQKRLQKRIQERQLRIDKLLARRKNR